MFRSNLGRACALSAVLLAVAPACSGGDATSRPSTTAADVTSQPGGADPGVTTTTTPIHLIEVMFAGGQVAGGAQRSTVRRGERVRIRITSDVVDEVHVHTYDLKADVAPGQPAQIDLVATIPGRHEVELEKKAKQLLVLEVR